MRVGYRTTLGSRRQRISKLGWAGFIMKKSTSIKLRTELKSTNLLRKSLGFHFSLMNMIPMMALAIKKKKHREKSIEPAISQMESLRQCPLGWLICTGACLSSHSCSQELSLLLLETEAPLWASLRISYKARNTRGWILAVWQATYTSYFWRVCSLRWALLWFHVKNGDTEAKRGKGPTQDHAAGKERLGSNLGLLEARALAPSEGNVYLWHFPPASFLFTPWLFHVCRCTQTFLWLS